MPISVLESVGGRKHREGFTHLFAENERIFFNDHVASPFQDRIL